MLLTLTSNIFHLNPRKKFEQKTPT